ncbi:helix-turn-helix domain-containing protein [Devosia lacusdianchii]|uniref:helix-turn-helix domain-containing protein n=1 Tax=Devosia lacusdianchii TaxID=2917991 RepID=UPI001F05D665|nr:helix-turn-helix domain-containing protein [Devosia sp. JXJ CY 41]
MNLLDIGVLSERSGMPPSALRHYEAIGLIESVARRGLRRQYDPYVLTQLSLIALGKSAGFSLDQIKGMFGENGTPELPRLDLHKRADAIDEQIRGLMTLRDALRHVAECQAENHMTCPKFQQLLRVASQKARRR